MVNCFSTSVYVVDLPLDCRLLPAFKNIPLNTIHNRTSGSRTWVQLEPVLRSKTRKCYIFVMAAMTFWLHTDKVRHLIKTLSQKK